VDKGVSRLAAMKIHSPLTTYYSRILAAALLLLINGCANVGYYWQSVSGQLGIWRRERPIEEVINDAATTEALRRKLAYVTRVREFASRELSLPDNRSYRSYADLGRPFAVWNVFAAPEFSTEPLRWCFPFTGCVSYRGYFDREEAERFAAGLAEQGHDVYVGGVPAYSTLGWFADPVLSTFIRFPDAEVARLVFHELAHQVVYVKGDTVFNESFAVVVEQEGLRRWIAHTGDAGGRESYDRNRRVRAEFVRIVQKHRARLEALYRSRLAPEAMRARKREILDELNLEYRAAKAGWDGYAGYDAWFARGPNNAQLASVALYTQRVPSFEALFQREGGDWGRFYNATKELAALTREQRDARLAALSPANDK
jgi:predicted aminopeptidase